MFTLQRTVLSVALSVCCTTALGFSQTGSSDGVTSQQLDRIKRSFPISGSVLMDDGTSPRERVMIESVCPNRTRTETFSNKKGVFHFNLGGETDVLQDASVNNSFAGYGRLAANAQSPMAVSPTTPGVQGSSMSQSEAMQCFLRASMPGYRSNNVTLDNLIMSGTSNLPPIVLRRLEKSPERPTIDVTTLQAPPAARKAYDRARKELARGDSLNAVEDLRKAIKEYPVFAVAMVQLGEIYAQQGLFDQAERLFDNSISADPKFAPAYFDLAPIAGERQNWHRMAQLSDVGLSLDSSYAAGYYFNALAYYRLADYDKAEKSARQARSLDPNHTLPKVELVLADVFVKRHQPAEAVEQLRTFLKFSPNSPEAARARDLISKLDTTAQK